MPRRDRRFVPLYDFYDTQHYVKGMGYTATTEVHDEILDRLLREGKVKVVETPEGWLTAEGRVD